MVSESEGRADGRVGEVRMSFTSQDCYEVYDTSDALCSGSFWEVKTFIITYPRRAGGNEMYIVGDCLC